VEAFAIKTVLEQLSTSDPKARSAKPQEFFDRSIVEEPKQKGFFQQIWR
jgi:hypothetical protein